MYSNITILENIAKEINVNPKHRRISSIVKVIDLNFHIILFRAIWYEFAGPNCIASVLIYIS
jgi:hypothetical protein